MKHTTTLFAAALAALGCPLLTAFAHGHSPAVTRHRQLAISLSASHNLTKAIATNANLDAGAPAPQSLDGYTGIVLDVSGFANIQRSPAPAIYGPQSELVYPDRSHVPTPDQVQDESIVRYYRTMDAAKSGVGGDHPLVIVPTAVVGPAKDSVVLSAADEETFRALDKKIHFTDTWKVGFLVPADQ